MAYITNDETIRSFLFDYSRLAEYQLYYQEAQDTINRRLPAYMRRFRKLANSMTQAQLAEALEVDHSYISKLENGREVASKEFLEKFNAFVKKWGQDA